MIELKNVSFKYELQQEKTIKNLDLYSKTHSVKFLESRKLYSKK